LRRLLRLLCATALGVSVLGALPARAAQPTWVSVASYDPLLNENGDGYWESATVHVVITDADAAHWTLAKGGQTVAEADLTAEQLSYARGWGGLDLPVDSTTAGRALAAGTYTFTVTATSSGQQPASGSTSIYVSTAPPLTALTPGAAAVYPADDYPGVAHEATFRHGLDRTILDWGTAGFQVVGNGEPIAPWAIDSADPVLRWDGYGTPAAGGTSGPAPAGAYRVRLLLRDDDAISYGPLSQPFRLSWGHRILTEHTVMQPATATRTATLTQRGARVRASHGSLRYRAVNTDWRTEPLVRTAHRVRVPRDRAAGTPVRLVIRGRRQWTEDLDLELVDPAGRVHGVDVFDGLDKRTMIRWIPRRMIAADGTVRFRILWSSYGPTGAPHRVGRTDAVGVRVNRYVWRDLDRSLPY
jgi:hypothetical protein